MGGIYRRKYRDEKGNLRQGAIWQIKYFQNGQEIRESSGSTKKTDAERLLKQREGQIVDGRFQGLQIERITFGELMQDLLNDYRVNGKKSLERTERGVQRLQEYFDGCRAKEITTDRIKKYMAERKKQLAANGTINRELSFLKRAFSLAVKAGKLDRRPHIPMLEENNIRPFFFEHEDYLKLRDALPGHLRPVIILAYHSGMRRGEIQGLTWDKVDLVNGRINLTAGSTKNGEARIIPLAGELYEAIQRQAVENRYPGCPYVFHDQGRRLKDWRVAWEKALEVCGFNPLYLCRACGAISEHPLGTDKRDRRQAREKGENGKRRKQADGFPCQKCGSTKVRRYGRTMHDFRRSAVRNAVRSGVPEGIAMRLSGHKTRSVFERYNIVNEADLVTATAQIVEYHQKLEAGIAARQPHQRIDPSTTPGSISGSSNEMCNSAVVGQEIPVEKHQAIQDYGAAARDRTGMTVSRRGILRAISRKRRVSGKPLNVGINSRQSGAFLVLLVWQELEVVGGDFAVSGIPAGILIAPCFTMRRLWR